MVIVSFNPALTDGVTYDANGFAIRPPNTTSENYYSYTNRSRTQMRFRINLKNILGSKYVEKNEMMRLQFKQAFATYEAGNTIPTMNQNAQPWWRSSNIVVSGENWVGGGTERLFGNISSYDLQVMDPIKLLFHRADFAGRTLTFNTGTVSNLNHIYLYRAVNQNKTGWDGSSEWEADFAQPFSAGELGDDGVQDAFGDVNGDRVPDGLRKDIYDRRWMFVGDPDLSPTWDTTPTLTGLQFRILDMYYTGTFLRFSIDIPASEPVSRTGGNNVVINLQPLPNTPNQWYSGDRYGNWDKFTPQNKTELWFYTPADGILELTIELRDVHLNQLQPVLTVNENNQMMPAMTIVMDIA